MRDTCLRDACELLRQRVNPTIVYLFGSRAKGEARPTSDVDIAVLTAHGLDDPLGLAAHLEDVLGCSVDLIDLTKASTVLKVQVIAHGRLLAATSERAVALFEMHVLSEYGALGDERGPILRRVERDGSVF